METENKVTMGRVLSASVEVSNSGDAARQYGITAHVDIQDGKVTNVHQGIVTDIESNSHLADFNSWGGAERLEMTYSGAATERVAILEAVEAFIEATMTTEININVTE